MTIDIRNFLPPGPVAAAFINDDTPVCGIKGPMRGGKTVSALYKRLRRAMNFPRCTDGNIRYRATVIRDSYGALYSTTVPSWHEVIAKNRGKWAGTEGRPATHELEFDLPNGGRLLFRLRFVSIQNDTIENLTRGAEESDYLLEEADLLNRHVKTYVLSRAGQYPPRKLLAPGVMVRGQVDCVFNAPDVENWTFSDFAENGGLPNHRLHEQPGGLDPKAENIHNIQGGRGYYEMLAATNPKWFVDRMVHAKFGPSRSGEAVYPEYDDAKHCGNQVIEKADCPLRLGLDQNLANPACTISQWMPSGQWRVIDEIVPGRMGASAFGAFIRDWLNRDYKGLPVALATADPAAKDGADTENGELAWYEAVQRALGVPVQLAPSQEVSLRQDAVRQVLTAPDILLPNGERVPAFALSAKCKMLRKGFISHYRYRRMRGAEDAPLSPKVDKNDFSDPHDALQYDMLNSRGRLNVVSAKQTAPRYFGARPAGAVRPVAPGSRADFDVFKV